MKHVLAGVVGIIVGVLGTVLYMGPAPEPMTMSHEMMSMTEGLVGKTGDAFDEAFLSEMIVHHQGAVSMAESALKDAKHEELKGLASAIIAAQNTEIQMMQGWLKDWYGK
jgi:uncharacterized protein (DUF305 family)